MDIVNIHASCVVLAGAAAAFDAPEDAGLLLLGESGCGKSDFALRLIERGAMLVADDRVELGVHAERLIARAPGRLAGLLEVRRAGIIRLPYAADAVIALAVAFDPAQSPAGGKPRLPEPAWYVPPAALALPESARPPLLSLNAFECSAPAKAILAAAAFGRQRFYDELKPL